MSYKPFNPGRDHDLAQPTERGEQVWRPSVSPGKRSLTSRLVQRRALPGAAAPAADSGAVEKAAQAPGAGLPRHLSAQFGRSLGADLSGVRVHTGPEAAAATSSVQARAFAQGNDIHFAPGTYDPGSRDGQHLIAHEVAHTVQQAGGAAAGPQYALEISGPGDSLEQEADSLADAMVRGEPAGPVSGTGPSIQRDPDEDVRVAPQADAADRLSLQGGTHRFAALMYIYESGDFGEGGLSPSSVVGSNGETLQQLHQLYRSGRIASENGMFNPSKAGRWAGSIRQRGFIISSDDPRAAELDDHGSDGLHPLYLRAATEVQSTESIDERLEGEQGIRGFIVNGHATQPREVRRERGQRELRLREMQHDGAGNWTNADGSPLSDEDQEQLRGDLAANSAGRGILRGEALTQYQAFVGQSSNPAVDAETWVRSHRTDEQRAQGRAASGADTAASSSTAAGAPSAVPRRIINVAGSSPGAPSGESSVSTQPVIAIGNSDAPSGESSVVTQPIIGIGNSDASSGESSVDIQPVIAIGTPEPEPETPAPAPTPAVRVVDADPETSFAVSEGRATATRSQERETFRDGRRTRVESRERQVSAGAVADDTNGYGVSLGTSNGASVEAGDAAASASTATVVEVTDRRLAATRTTEASASYGSLSASTKSSRDGSFTIALQPQLDHDPPDYSMTFTIHLGGSVEGGAARGANGGTRASGGVTARASASSDVVTTRTISIAEARQYLDAADRHDAGDSGSTLPEFGRLARLRAAWGERDMAQSSAAVLLGNSQSASQLADGESVSMTLTGSVGGDATLGAQNGGGASASVSAGGSITYVRQVSVERIEERGHALVQVQVSYMRTDEGHYGASGGLAGASAGAQRSESSGAGQMVRVVLDPSSDDYDARYGEVMGALTPEQLRAISASDRFRITRQRTSTTESDGYTVTEGVGPFSATFSDSSSHNEDVDVDESGRQTANIVGQQEGGLGLSAGGVQVVSGRVTNRATAAASGDGLELDLDEEQNDTDIARTLAGVASDAADRSAGENAARVAANASLAGVRRLLATEHRRLDRIHLNPGEVEELVVRAADPRWPSCCSTVDDYEAWRTLATRMQDAGRMPQETDEKRYGRNLRIARLVTRWVEGHGDEGRAALDRALYHMGARLSSANVGPRLGRHTEWPPDLTATETVFQGLKTRVEGLDAQLRGLLSSSNADTRGTRICGSLRSRLNSVQGEVRDCHDFESADARNQLLDQIDGLLSTISRSLALFNARLRARQEGASGESESEEAVEGAAPEEAELDAETEGRLLNERANLIIHRLMDNKRTESGRLARISRMVQEWSSLWGPTPNELLSELHELYVGWYGQVQRLRALYSEYGIPPEQWCVSTGPYAHRNRRREPDIDRFVRLYLTANQQEYGWSNSRTTVQAWRGEYNSY